MKQVRELHFTSQNIFDASNTSQFQKKKKDKYKNRFFFAFKEQTIIKIRKLPCIYVFSLARQFTINQTIFNWRHSYWSWHFSFRGTDSIWCWLLYSIKGEWNTDLCFDHPHSQGNCLSDFGLRKKRNQPISSRENIMRTKFVF